MKEKELVINYVEYDSMEEMPAAERELMEQAMKATATAYAPYSRFHVGAAVRLADGTVVTGSNQENIAYPSGLCAERVALFSASAQKPDQAVEMLAVVGHTEGEYCEASPCGACRQVMAEYQTLGRKPLSVIMFGTQKAWKFERVDDILPFIFDSFNDK